VASAESTTGDRIVGRVSHPTPPVLVGCAHGTRSTSGRRAVAELLVAVGDARPDLDVEPAFVDVQPPSVAEVVARLAGSGRACVVVPLLLSAGFHVRTDVADAVRSAAGAVAAPALGPDPRLVEMLRDRLQSAGAVAGDGVVLAAAGSSEPRAGADVELMRSALAARWTGPVVAGFGASATPTVAEAVTALRDGGSRRVAVASYLLAPGHFHDRLDRAGADVVAAPLLDGLDGLDGPVDVRLVEIVLDRYTSTIKELRDDQGTP